MPRETRSRLRGAVRSAAVEVHVRRAAGSAVAFAVVASFLGLAAPSLADPGTPGLSKASNGVYVSGEAELGVNELGGPDEAGTPPGERSAPGASAGGLPFTGLAAPAMLVAGLIALALSAGLRALGRPARA